MPFLTDRVKREFLESCEQIRHGRLTLLTPEGEVFRFGAGEPEAELRLHDWGAVTAAAARGDVGFGEAYVDGYWDTPCIATLSALALRNLDVFERFAQAGPLTGLKFRMVDRLLRRNSQSGAARNIRAHYDVGNEFYQLWLDPSMTYSAALFSDDDTDLERAQVRKYDRILGRLDQGESVLEIGCGWGGFAERAADDGRHVTGLTISPSQKAYADARLDGRADIRLEDYRKVSGRYDNIVSIEMIEAVGEASWPTYFATVKSRLAEGGRAVVQAITVPDDSFPLYRRTSDFIRQYTFPGGMLLSNGKIAEQAQKAGLVVRDVFSFGGDYAQTCQTWLDRLDDRADRIRGLGFDERFLRSWRYYLGISAATFAVRNTDVVQVELAHA